ncbi:MAG TPA: substrate-binding domain-containing protein, partial [Steroidobacteraceae bacterium]|nr:substrate-binding domain-containing protein [Steroidobacteraceae bacterium]
MDKNGPDFRHIGLLSVGTTTIALALLGTQAVIAQQATLRVFTTRAIRTVLDRVGPEFERTSRHRLEITTDIAAPMVRRVRGGEPFDVLVAAPDQIDALVKDGFIIPDTRRDLAQSGIGVAVRQGAAIPDVSSVDAFK